jgi:endoglucanase
MKELLKQLCELDGVPGYEDEVWAFIEKEAAPYATSMEVDPVGNLIVFKKGAKERKRPLLMMAHMDEVGFLVKDITEDGMLKLAPAGGIDPRVLIGRRMRVGENKIPGIISLKAIHLTTPEERKDAPGLNSLYIDIGCTSREQAEGLVMRGDPAMFDSKFFEFVDHCALRGENDISVAKVCVSDRVKNFFYCKGYCTAVANFTGVYTATEFVGFSTCLCAACILVGIEHK